MGFRKLRRLPSLATRVRRKLQRRRYTDYAAEKTIPNSLNPTAGGKIASKI